MTSVTSTDPRRCHEISIVRRPARDWPGRQRDLATDQEWKLFLAIGRMSLWHDRSRPALACARAGRLWFRISAVKRLGQARWRPGPIVARGRSAGMVANPWRPLSVRACPFPFKAAPFEAPLEAPFEAPFEAPLDVAPLDVAPFEAPLDVAPFEAPLDVAPLDVAPFGAAPSAAPAEVPTDADTNSAPDSAACRPSPSAAGSAVAANASALSAASSWACSSSRSSSADLVRSGSSFIISTSTKASTMMTPPMMYTRCVEST